MNVDQLKGDWKQLEGKVKAKWGKFTDDDMKIVEGKREELCGRIQERYGCAKEEAQKELDEFCKTL
jgi:uncharacterized protein YjbJ (UPF0337 family)